MKEYTAAEAASELDLHPGTVRRQIANGRIRATKRGRDLWVTQTEIDRYRRDVLGKVGQYARAKPRAKRAARKMNRPQPQ